MRPDDTTNPVAAWAEYPSPVGRITAAATSPGLLRLEFGPRSPDDPAQHDLTRHDPTRPQGGADGCDRWLTLLDTELTRYFAGELRQFTVPLDWSLVSGARAHMLRTLVQRVAYGETTTYGQLATDSGRPGAARLVGTVMGSNPIAIVVPCHRVLASDGSLGGYGPGIAYKRQLLELEGALPEPLALW